MQWHDKSAEGKITRALQKRAGLVALPAQVVAPQQRKAFFCSAHIKIKLLLSLSSRWTWAHKPQGKEISRAPKIIHSDQKSNRRSNSWAHQFWNLFVSIWQIDNAACKHIHAVMYRQLSFLGNFGWLVKRQYSRVLWLKSFRRCLHFWFYRKILKVKVVIPKRSVPQLNWQCIWLKASYFRQNIEQNATMHMCTRRTVW